MVPSELVRVWVTAGVPKTVPHWSLSVWEKKRRSLLVVVGRQRDTAHGDEVRGVEALEDLRAFLTLYG